MPDMNKPVLQKMIKELCGLENRDRVYLPTEMRVGNGWNGSLEGFFSDGVAMVYCQGGNTDWSECASLDSVLRDNGFSICSRGSVFRFSGEQCRKFIANFTDYYNRQNEEGQKRLLLLHKEHDKQMRVDVNSVLNRCYSKLRLENMYLLMQTPKQYRTYQEIASAIEGDMASNFAELCGMDSNGRVERWKKMASDIAAKSLCWGKPLYL